MQNDTRALFDKYVAQIAVHNGISPAAVGCKFTVTPSVQQRLETANVGGFVFHSYLEKSRGSYLKNNS